VRSHILVVALGTRDRDVGAVADVKAVRVVAFAITGRVVDSNISDRQTLRAVDAKTLNGGVLDVQG